MIAVFTAALVCAALANALLVVLVADIEQVPVDAKAAAPIRGFRSIAGKV